MASASASQEQQQQQEEGEQQQQEEEEEEEQQQQQQQRASDLPTFSYQSLSCTPYSSLLAALSASSIRAYSARHFAAWALVSAYRPCAL
jgi:hypothetical protein